MAPRRRSALMAALAALLLASISAYASASASDMSIIAYNAGHGVRGVERAEAEVRALYDLWRAEHGRPAANGELGEYERRLAAFRDNLRFVDAHNADAERRGFRLGMNQFADLTNEEYRAIYLGAKPSEKNRAAAERYRHGGLEALPESVDWREKGAVAAVKNQGQCGSCWAFSAVSTVESINQIITGEMITLSEQELVECSTNGQNSGCEGGLMDDAFDFIVKNDGIDTEADYPYSGQDGKCDLNRKNAKVVTIDSFEDVPKNDEKSLQKAVVHQPVSVAIEAGGREFQLYSSGIFSGRCGTQLDHGVVAVGYGTENGKDYWIVRNSWGPKWGESGYVRLERNVGAPTGKCGIAMIASYPIKNGLNPPEPAPVPPSPVSPPTVCSESYSCPAGTTCCCTIGIRKLCLLWGCCPAEGATCCKDHTSCCPQKSPVCDVKAGTCATSKNNPLTTKALKRIPAKWR